MAAIFFGSTSLRVLEGGQGGVDAGAEGGAVVLECGGDLAGLFHVLASTPLPYISTAIAT